MAQSEPRPRSFHWTLGLVVGLILMAIIAIIAVVAPMLMSTSANELGVRAAPPSAEHPLGTDAAGHDMLARTLVATRLTLLMTVATTFLAVLVGVLIGGFAWTLPSRVRQVILRIVDAFVAFPAMLLALVVAAVLGPSIISAVLAISFASAPYFARLTANLAAGIARQDFVVTATLLAVPKWRVVRSHLVPNMAEPLLVLIASSFAQSLTAISALSFVGLGVQSPDYDWGKLLSTAMPSLLSGRAVESLGPAVMIVLSGAAATLIGDGLAAAANPRSRAYLAGTQRKVAPRNQRGATLDESRAVRVRDLVVTSPTGTELVKGVDIDIQPGEIVGLVGESGSGKSLTAMSIAKLLPEELHANASELSLGGIDLTGTVDPRTLATSIGLIYQDPGTTFNPALRMGTQLTEVLTTHEGLSGSQAKRRILAALETVRIVNPARVFRQHPHELSGGMRQRAMIASAVATSPQLLIADEPTTALDVTVQAEILRYLKLENKRDQTSILFISHDLAVVGALCDRVYVMRDGVVVEALAAAELAAGDVSHPYTKQLLAAAPRVTDSGGDAGASPRIRKDVP